MSREGKSTDQSKLLGEKSFTSSPSSYRSRPNFCPSVPLSLVFLFLPFLSLAGRISPPPVPFGVVLPPFALPSPWRPPSPAALSTLEASSRAELEPGFFFFLPSPLPLVLLCPSYAKTFCWFEKVFKCQKKWWKKLTNQVGDFWRNDIYFPSLAFFAASLSYCLRNISASLLSSLSLCSLLLASSSCCLRRSSALRRLSFISWLAQSGWFDILLELFSPCVFNKELFDSDRL